MPLDPQARALLEALARIGMPQPGTVPVEVLRAVHAKRRLALPPGPDLEVQPLEMPTPAGTVAARLYRPREGPLPALLWFHGGGFAIGSVAESDADCRHLAALSGCAILSVEYRLAPEHPFPAGLEDCMATTSWVVAHAGGLGLDPSRIGVGGDSAGGNLAACVARIARERGGPPLRFQLLVYPITDLASLDTLSYLANADGFYLSRRSMEYFRDQYVPDAASRTDPSVSPLRAADLRGLPPAFVVTAEFDPLRDEGDAYARRLQDAGVAVTHRRYDGMIHGFFSMHTHLDRGKQVMRDAAEALRTGL
jgi:acetyl esterase/lipase